MHSPNPPASSPRPRPIQIDFPGFEIRSEDVVVDVGCGVGDVCVYAGHQGADVIGIDVEDLLVARARENMAEVPARSFRGIVSACDPIPLPDQTADVIVCTEVLEHVEAPERFLSELSRIGKPNARYLISVPHPMSEAVMQAVAPSWYWEKPFHIHVYEPERLDALLESSGLTVEARLTSGFYWSMFWFLRMASGMDHPYTFPEHPMISAWDEIAAHLVGSPKGRAILSALDQAAPKSQVRIARKVGQPSEVASSFGGPTWRRSRWHRMLRDGALRVGGFDVRWSVRRAHDTESTG